ncbi:hypothetical protein FGG08_005059 [Glutinoglossum americanum]|uniref:Myb-like domain-containing protein n=1 Tax=Glutinoglossum americanum TaxID=1670608 RepID=A0A9P8L3A4_9PEZI|nr:hypothetical protein FGG08_005059 [Glutinoglossum americanum]
MNPLISPFFHLLQCEDFFNLFSSFPLLEMAAFDPIPYTYVPTAPRFKSTKAPYNRTPKQVSILDKIQCIKASGLALGMPQPPAAVVAVNDSRNDGPGIRKTSTIYGGNDKEEGREEEGDLPTIEDLLYTTLKKEGFATEDSNLDHRVRGIGEVSVKERGSFADHNRSALGEDSGGSLDDPIVLLGDDDLSASEAEVDHGGLAENAEPDAGHFDRLETTVDSTTLAPPSSLDGWHDIGDYPETVQHLRLAKGALASNSMCPYSPSAHLSSELLHDHIDTEGLDTHRARSEAATSHSARPRSPPPRHSRASTGNQLGQEDRLHAGRSTADEREYEDELVRPVLNPDTFDKGERQQQEAEAEAEGEADNDDNEDDGQVQQEANDMAAAVTAKRISDNHLSGKEGGSPRLAERQRLLPSRDPSPEPGHDETGSDSDGNNNKPSNKADPDKDNGWLRPAKRRRRSSSYDGPMPKKRKHHLQQRSIHQRRPHSRKSYSLYYQGSRVTAVPIPEGRLPSPAPPALQVIDAEMPSDCYNLGQSSRDVLPTLVEVTFRPHSRHYCSFTAVVRDSCDGRGVSFSQLARLVENIGHIGKIDDFSIKPLEQHLFLLTGFSCYIASQPSSSGMTVSTTAETSPIRKNATHIQLQHGKAVDGRAFASRGSEPSSSDNDGGLSDSDPNSSSDDNGYSSEDEQRLPSARKRSPWLTLDEQRLLAYKKEGKSWRWIFRKFPTRTPAAVRTRWTVVQAKVK